MANLRCIKPLAVLINVIALYVLSTLMLLYNYKIFFLLI